MFSSKRIRYRLLSGLSGIGILISITSASSIQTIGQPKSGLWISGGMEALTENACQTRSCNSTFFTQLCGPCLPSSEKQPSIEQSPYPKEWNDAYLWAYTLGITTKTRIQDAAMDEPLVRKYAAQMMTEFAIKVLGLKPDTTRTCDFEDIKNETKDLQYYMILSCQLGIMGLDYYGTPDIVFHPNYVVRRDQFVTILSRALRGNKNNILTGELTTNDKLRNLGNRIRGKILDLFGISHNSQTKIDRYTKHLEAIKKLSVFKEYTLSIKEARGYVMIILKRLYDMGIEKVKG